MHLVRRRPVGHGLHSRHSQPATRRRRVRNDENVRHHPTVFMIEDMTVHDILADVDHSVPE
jgi:hypothetical protein